MTISDDLFRAINSNDIDGVKLLLQKKDIDINAVDEDRSKAFMVASFHGHQDIVDILITAGANVNAVSKDGYTALIYALGKNNIDIFKTLVNAGADINAQDKDGYTVLMWAAHNGYKEIVEILIDAGADMKKRSIDRGTALGIATIAGHKDIIDLIQYKSFEKELVIPATKGTFIGLSSVAKNNIPSIWNILEKNIIVKSASNLFCKSTSSLSAITPQSITNYISNKAASHNIITKAFVRSEFVMAFLVTASTFIYNLYVNRENDLSTNVCKSASVTASTFGQNIVSMGASLLGAGLCGGVVAPIAFSIAAGITAKKTGSYLYNYVSEPKNFESDKQR